VAREDVNIKVSANVAEAIRLWKAMEEGPKAMGNELDAMARKGQKSAKGLNDELGNMVGQWTSIAAGIAAAAKVLEAYVKMQRELRELEKGSTRTADSQSRELANLAPASVPLKQIRQDMTNLAVRRGVTTERAKETAGALLGAGFAYGDTMKEGGAGDVALRTLAATNASGKNIDAKALVDAMTGHLSATGQEKTAANLAAAGQTSQALFAGTKLEIDDLQNLAKVGKNIKDITGLGNEQMALLSQFKDVTSADIGATSMQASIMRLNNPGSRERKALSELGLNPQDVDFNGEAFYDVQSRLGAAFDQAGPNASRLRGQLFGQEGVLGGSVLFSKKGAASTQERLKMAANTSSFNRAAGITEGSLESKMNAADAETVKQFAADGFVDPEIARKQLMNKIKELGGGAFYQTLGTTAFDTAIGLGADADTATRTGMRWVGGNHQMAKDVVDKARAESVKVEISLTDQNGVAIPHKSEVNNVGKNKAPKER
jgi:hypothetical protein